MLARHVGVMLGPLLMAWVVGCNSDTPALTRVFYATGRWGGQLFEGTQKLGSLLVDVDSANKVIEGMLTGPSVSLMVRQGSVSFTGLMKLEFGDGTRLQTTYLTKSQDGNTLSGSGTLTDPDGTQHTVSFTLQRLQ